MVSGKVFVISLVLALLGGGALSYLYSRKVIAAVVGEYEKAAGEVGIAFSKAAGKLQAIKKAL